MAQYKYIRCDVYERGIYIFIGSLSELKEWVKESEEDIDNKDFVEMVLKKEHDTDCFLMNDMDGQGIVFLHEFPTTPETHSYLNHELLHATFHLLDFVGVEYRYGGSNEPYTYLHAYLTKMALIKEGYINIEVGGKK